MHWFFHVISMASQQPFAHSLMHLTTSMPFHFHTHSFWPLISYSRFLSKLAPGRGWALSGQIHWILSVHYLYMLWIALIYSHIHRVYVMCIYMCVCVEILTQEMMHLKWCWAWKFLAAAGFAPLNPVYTWAIFLRLQFLGAVTVRSRKGGDASLCVAFAALGRCPPRVSWESPTKIAVRVAGTIFSHVSHRSAAQHCATRMSHKIVPK